MDPRAPYDLSHLCDGRRTDFPLGMLVETVKVMLNGIYLEQDLDFLLRHKDGQSKIELRRPPAAGARLLVLRVPASDSTQHQRAPKIDDDEDVPPYDQLPKAVKDNVPAEQWPMTKREVVHPSARIPDSGLYINLKNGLIAEYIVGETTSAPLLPVHALHRT